MKMTTCLNRGLICALALLVFVGEAISAPVRFFKDVGDGRSALSAILTLVDGIAVDPEGNIYISHRSKNRVRKIDKNGIIATVAGNGKAGFSGDGGSAVEASLNFPAGLAFDKQGNLFIADRNNHRVRKVDPSGIITTIAGNGIADYAGDEEPATQASLNLPSDVACDGDGNIYISDRSNHRIRKVDSRGIITTFAGLGVAGFAGDFGPAEDAFLKFPFGITLDGAGNLYIADRGNNRVRKVGRDGVIITVAGDGLFASRGDYGPATLANLAYPTDVAVDDAGNLYIADRNNNRVRKVDTNGIIFTLMGTGQTDYNGDQGLASETNLHLPFALEVEPGSRSLVVVDRSHFRVRRLKFQRSRVETIAGNGKFLLKGDQGEALGATLNGPQGLVIDGRGNIVFADQMHHELRKIDSHGYISRFAGNGKPGNLGDGGPAAYASLFRPSALAIDREDNIYLVSPLANGWNIRKIDARGKITRFAGNGKVGTGGDGGPAIDASFYAIRDLAVDPEGNVLVADNANPFIRRIDKNGIITRVAEKRWGDLEGDIHPNGLTVDGRGNIYVADSGSSKIRKIDTAGNVTTVAGTGDFDDFGDGGPALLAGIRSPSGLAVSPAGELYVAEEQTHRIRKIDKNGIITLVAGTGEAGFSGDGGPAVLAQLNHPRRMVFDAAGDLYFTDRINNRIRRVDRKGIITTMAGNANFGFLLDGLEVNLMVHDFP
ncbi:MAG: SMP-30/gluconolactonase/LRE family protein [Nitrospinales bacterium]